MALLKDKLAALSRVNEGRNDILDYLKGLEPTNLQELTSTAGPDVLEAMNAFIYRLIGALLPLPLPPPTGVISIVISCTPR